MTRKLVSSLEGQRISKILPVAEHYEFRNPQGKVLFTVLTVDLFDAEGKRFECDVPSTPPRVKSHPYRVQYTYAKNSNYARWRCAIEQPGSKKHMRFATRKEAQDYCNEQMNRSNRLPSEEWRVLGKPEK